MLFYFLKKKKLQLVDGPVNILYSVASRQKKKWRNAGGKAEKTSMDGEGGK